MSARSAFSAALVFAALAAVPAQAQEPAPAPEPSDPAPVRAVERSRREPRDGGAVAVRAPRAREDNGAREARSRVRAAVAPATPAAVEAPAPPAPAAFDEDQGGRRRPGSAGSGGRSAGGAGGARPRGGVRRPDSGGGRVDGNRGPDNPRAQAVPRGRAPRPPQVVYAPSYGRRFYAGAGGLGYYFYDPWSWYAGYGWPGYASYGWGGYYGNAWGGYGNAWGGFGNAWGGPGVYGGPYGWSIGAVRLKVDPKDAEVYVDGYYAGIVDDFDGIWQRLRLDDGGYRIEIRKPGLDTLTFDVRVQPGRTITYRGEMTTTP